MCPAFGFAANIFFRLSLYQLQTNFGLSLNACADASFIGSYFCHKPSFPLNVEIPLSCDIPAPVRKTIFLAFLSVFSKSRYIIRLQSGSRFQGFLLASGGSRICM